MIEYRVVRRLKDHELDGWSVWRFDDDGEGDTRIGCWSTEDAAKFIANCLNAESFGEIL